jgi:hypothetical protein
MAKALFAYPTTYGIDVPVCTLMKLSQGLDADILYGDDASAVNVYNGFQSHDIIYGVGHGDCCVFTVQNLQDVMSVSHTCSDGLQCPTFLPQVSGKKVHLFSCLTGEYLGKYLGDNGAEYLGYNEAITLATWIHTYKPCVDDDQSNTTAFATADFAGTLALLNGGSIVDAYNAAYEKYQELIEYYNSQNTPIAPAVARLLKANQLSLVYYPGVRSGQRTGILGAILDIVQNITSTLRPLLPIARD